MPFNQLGQWEPLLDGIYTFPNYPHNCQIVDMVTKVPCQKKLNNQHDNHCRECGLIVCFLHSCKRYKGYKVCDICYYTLTTNKSCFLNQIEREILYGQSNFMPMQSLLSQKQNGASFFYKTSRGSRYFYKFTDGPTELRRCVGETPSSIHGYKANDLYYSGALVSSFSNTQFLNILKSNINIFKLRKACDDYEELDKYFQYFDNIEISGRYQKIYKVNRTLWSLDFDPLMLSPDYNSVEACCENGMIRYHVGDIIITSQFF